MNRECINEVLLYFLVRHWTTVDPVIDAFGRSHKKVEAKYYEFVYDRGIVRNFFVAAEFH